MGMRATTSTARKPTKSIRLPARGDFLTDGVRLVEVLDKSRDGYRVLDVMRFDEEENVETLNPDVAVRLWRFVEPEVDGSVA